MKLLTQLPNGLVVSLFILASWLSPNFAFGCDAACQGDHLRQQESLQREAFEYEEGEKKKAEDMRKALEKVDGHAAIAWHPDAKDVWAAWDHRSQNAAEQAALEACNRTMRGDCTIAISAYNASVAVMRSPTGALKIDWGNTPEEARQKAAGDCVNCKVAHIFTTQPIYKDNIRDESKHYFPSATVAQHLYVMLAEPKDAKVAALQSKTWLISGHQGFYAAQKQLLDRCKQDSGVECSVFSFEASGVFTRYFNKTDGAYWYMPGTSKIDAETKVAMACLKAKAQCSIEQTYDSKIPSLIVLDNSAK